MFTSGASETLALRQVLTHLSRCELPAALAAAKARGVKLGANGAVLATAHRAGAELYADGLREPVNAARRDGVGSLRGLATWLNDNGVPTRGGARWHAAMAGRLLARLGRTCFEVC